ncbi:hypothetical protein [Streptomyces griseoaurantiacus]|uniref:hypothetical protein n=1 Tax=Streptomyces griseoaurantiacus TaxID=68213 RepID=UPI0030E474D8
MDEVEPTMMKATCHTPGCPVAEQTFVEPMYPAPAPPVWRAQCGQCGQPVTDLVPADV